MPFYGPFVGFFDLSTLALEYSIEVLVRMYYCTPVILLSLQGRMNLKVSNLEGFYENSKFGRHSTRVTEMPDACFGKRVMTDESIFSTCTIHGTFSCLAVENQRALNYCSHSKILRDKIPP